MSTEISGVDFGDMRLNRRMVMIYKRMQEGPGCSFPEAMGKWKELKGLYRFFSNERVSGESILWPHVAKTRDRCKRIGGEGGVVLVLHDTTYFNYSYRGGLEGMGYIGTNPVNRGMLLHSSICVSGLDGRYLGMLNMDVIVRDRMYKKSDRYKGFKIRECGELESSKWYRGVCRVKDLLGATGVKVVHVCDREADIYDLFGYIESIGHGYVIRCGNVRRRTRGAGSLFSEFRRSIYKGMYTLIVRDKGTNKYIKKHLEVRSCTVELKAPKKYIRRESESLKVNVVIVREVGLKKGAKEGLLWILYTSESVETYEDCMRVIGYYKRRWFIEEFHKVLKTGCGMERRQLKKRERLEKVLAFFCVLAYQIMLMRHVVKKGIVVDRNDVMEILTPLRMKILKMIFPDVSSALTPPEAILSIAKLGGFIGRKSDNTPGWLVIMRGLIKLIFLEIGYLMAIQKDVGKV